MAEGLLEEMSLAELRERLRIVRHPDWPCSSASAVIKLDNCSQTHNKVVLVPANRWRLRKRRSWTQSAKGRGCPFDTVLFCSLTVACERLL